MIDPVEVFVLYLSCGCVRWRDSLLHDRDVYCEHAGAYTHAVERRIVDRGV